jgi:prevent-host-death family protein
LLVLKKDTVMNELDVFSARDLRNRSGGLLKHADEGRFSLISKHGRPAALVVPFDAQLLQLGIHRYLAVRLYAQHLVTLSQAAKLAGLPIEQFLNVLAGSGVDAVDYPAKEVAAELKALR